jgi:hypothetical protein
METPAHPGKAIRYTLLFTGTCRRTNRLRTRGYDSPGASDAHCRQAESRAAADLTSPRFLRAAVRRT